MNQLIHVKLKEIQYSGDDVGPHFEIQLSLESKRRSIKATVRHGRTKTFDDRIFDGFVRRDSFLKMEVIVRENDPFFDDVGTSESTVSLESLQVNVNNRENIVLKIYGRGWERKKIAVLKIALEIKIDDGIRYIADVEPNGWLQVKLNSDHIHPLPNFLKVRLYDQQDEREFFEILEGRLKGQKGSVKRKSERSSYLLKDQKHLAPALLSFDLSEELLSVRGLGKFNADMDERNPLPVGHYDLEIPYEPHPLGERYSRSSRFSKTWFRIGHRGDRFLHVGDQSGGCITVLEVRKWTKSTTI